MKLFNNTPGQVYFGIDSIGSGDCGTIDPDGTSDWPSYDNKDNVMVSFAAYPFSQPPDVTSFSITIPESGTGMAVTIGIYQE